MTREDATEVLEPREQSFDLPAATVAAQRPTILGLYRPVAAVRRDQFDAFFGELFRERVAVVGLVADEPLGSLREEAGIERGLDERDFIWRSTGHVDGDRKARAVCH